MVSSRFHSVALVLFVALSLLSGSRAQGRSPCHPNKQQQGKGVACGGITLPNNLCGACGLKPTTANGNFKNCKSIHNLDSPQCKQQLKEYVRLNKCDAKRRQQVKSWKTVDKIGLDYFVYSICELSCDCIPAGTKQSDYNKLAAKHSDQKPTLYTNNRGNCPAHAFYDICKVLPNVRYFKKPGGKNTPSWPKACPLLTKWFRSPAGRGWEKNNNVKTNFAIKRFLNGANVANAGKSRNNWNRCWRLEKAQNRI